MTHRLLNLRTVVIFALAIGLLNWSDRAAARGVVYASTFRGDVVVRLDDEGGSLFRFDLEAMAFAPFRLDHMEKVLLVSGDGSTTGSVVGITSSGLVLRTYRDAGFRDWSLSMLEGGNFGRAFPFGRFRQGGGAGP